MKLCAKFERNRAIRGGVIAITLWPWTCFKYCARFWDNFHQVWPSTTYPCLNCSIFWCWYVMYAVTLTFDPLTLKVRCTKWHVIKVTTEFEQNQAIFGWIIDNFANFSTRYVTPWPWPMTSWAWIYYSTLCFLCLNYVQNLSEIEWSMAELSTISNVFACNFREWVTSDRAFSGVREPNFTKLREDLGRSSQHCTFVSEFEYPAAFSNAGGSQLSDILNDANFLTFWPSPL